MKIYTKKELFEYGYKYEGMVGIDRVSAYEIFRKKEQEVYRLYYSNSKGLIEGFDDIFNHQGIFGVNIE